MTHPRSAFGAPARGGAASGPAEPDPRQPLDVERRASCEAAEQANLEACAHAPRIVLRDALAAFLGAVPDGIVEYAYADAVKLAGHSCPTVASAWLMTRAALRALYGDALPERGGVRVELQGALHEGVNGVIANVVGLVTGAAGDGGFKGIGGRFVRCGLLRGGVADVAGQLRYTRLDNADAVTVSARLERVPSDARVAALLPRCLVGAATPDDEALFRTLWQGRVQRLLLDHADDPEVIELRR